MIERHGEYPERADIWARLAEPLPTAAISWRQDGKVITRDGKYLARFVCYVEANTVRERLDAVVPGEWDLTLELLPQLPLPEVDDLTVSFKARLQILGVIREDVGTGKDYKAAATDAFKRAGVRFGIAHELYAYEQNWVQVDSDSKFAKPLEDPGAAYARRYGGKQNGNGGQQATLRPTPAPETKTSTPKASSSGGEPAATPSESSNGEFPSCPVCGGRMWDNRASKRNPKAPDFKCRDRSCEGVVWPGKTGEGNKKLAAKAKGNAKEPRSMGGHVPGLDDDEPPLDEDQPLDDSPLGMSLDDIPF